MANERFIPGPWSVEPREDCPGYTLYDADGDMIDYLSESRWIDDRDDPEMVASLRLIAAAPDLYAALDRCVRKLRMCAETAGNADFAVNALCAPFETVLASARGELDEQVSA